MADGTVRLYPDSTGKIIDTSELTVGANTVERQRVAIADPANATGVANVGTPGVDPGGSAQGLIVVKRPGQKGKFRNLAATVQAVKASAGTLYGILVINTSGATCYVQVFDLATGGVTLGTTTPDLEFLLATASVQFFALGENGIAFGTAISIASTTTEGGLTGSAAGVQVMPVYI